MTVRLVVTGRARFTAPLALGSGESTLATDRPIARDDDGRPCLTATAVAGALRSALARLAPSLGLAGEPGGDVLARLFGEALDDEAGGGRRGRTSRLAVAAPRPVQQAAVALRDGVGIHRDAGAARDDIKYDFEVAERGASFSIRLELHGVEVGDSEALLLAIGLEEWERGRLSLGGRAGTGLGRSVLEDVEVHRVDLGHREALRSWLRSRPAGQERPRGEQIGPGAAALRSGQGTSIELTGPAPDGSWPGWFEAEIALESKAPMLVGGPAPVPSITEHGSGDAANSDAQPIQSGRGADRGPLLPGSSLRGALRTRAEQIVRQLGGPAAACDPLEKDSCGRRPLPADFEARWAVENAAPARRAAVEAERAAAIRDELCCPICRLFGNTRLGGRVQVEEAPLHAGVIQLIDHVAIDRFTGGAADARKFDAAAVMGATSVIRVSVDRPQPWEVALCLHVLRDLAEGWVPVGSRVTRGYGAVAGRLQRLTFADMGAGPLAAVTATASRQGLWRISTFSAPAGQRLVPTDPLREMVSGGQADLETLAAGVGARR